MQQLRRQPNSISIHALQDLTDVAFQAIMNTLLGYVKRDKYVDPLAEKLATRLGAVAEVSMQ